MPFGEILLLLATAIIGAEGSCFDGPSTSCSVCYGRLEVCCCSENPALVRSVPNPKTCSCDEYLGWASILLFISASVLSVCFIFCAVGSCYGLWRVNDSGDLCSRLFPTLAGRSRCWGDDCGDDYCLVADASCQSDDDMDALHKHRLRSPVMGLRHCSPSRLFACAQTMPLELAAGGKDKSKSLEESALLVSY